MVADECKVSYRLNPRVCYEKFAYQYINLLDVCLLLTADYQHKFFLSEIQIRKLRFLCSVITRWCVCLREPPAYWWKELKCRPWDTFEQEEHQWNQSTSLNRCIPNPPCTTFARVHGNIIVLSVNEHCSLDEEIAHQNIKQRARNSTLAPRKSAAASAERPPCS